MSDIALLMARDPFEHTDADIDAMIERYRASRTSFNSAPAAAPAPKLTKKEQEVQRAGITGLSLNLEMHRK